jgi:hypothetical protein
MRLNHENRSPVEALARFRAPDEMSSGYHSVQSSGVTRLAEVNDTSSKMMIVRSERGLELCIYRCNETEYGDERDL